MEVIIDYHRREITSDNNQVWKTMLTTLILNDTHITARNEFVDKYIDLPDDFWDVIFTDEKPLQNFPNAKTKIWRTTEEANHPLLRVIKDKYDNCTA